MVGVLGPVVVAEELAVELWPGGVGCGGTGGPVAVAALVATAAAYWLICCMRFRMKSGGRAPGGDRRPRSVLLGVLDLK